MDLLGYEKREPLMPVTDIKAGDIILYRYVEEHEVTSVENDGEWITFAYVYIEDGVKREGTNRVRVKIGRAHV